MKKYDEKDLESTIEAHLLANGYTKSKDKDFDKDFCVDREILFGFLQSTQKDELNELDKKAQGQCEAVLLKELDKAISQKGLCAVLKNGFKARGVEFRLLYRKSDDKKNETLIKRYESNVLSVARQVHYSLKNENSLDMVIFVNGVATFSIELKNLLTGQDVADAIEQYRRDRNPNEKIFSAGRCVAHFALDNDSVYMTTRLEGKQSEFLPFNRGLNDGKGDIGLQTGAGNPAQEGKMKSAYFWERILAKDTVIKILLDFVQSIKDGESNRLIFPRYHQFDLVDKLLKDCVLKGAGQRYLIQHSAGSGKSNSISYLAHQLTGLRDSEDNLIFDSVIVVTDRIVLDRQISESIQNFEHTQGIIGHADTSKNLRQDLEGGKKIIISTIQKFPFVVERISALGDKHFAIIIDEAHSSQSGQSAAKMGEAIGKQENDDYESMQDKIISIIKGNKLQPNASYFAFTATPKQTTLEMFGRKCEVGGVEKFVPFHLYSMKQAIEEGYILDVVAHYTTYKSYYKIIKTISENPRYDKQKASAKIRRYVEGNQQTIAIKANEMIEHFRAHSAKQMRGKAKAMVVTRSRKDALNYYLEFKRLLKEKNLPFKALVAFSGELNQNGETYTEAKLNGFSESSLKNEFKKECYRFLIVAEKYQTGFDEPLLHTMYVDKKLSGINAVQTLSRLNRRHKDKFDTCVLDFANDTDEIAEAFGRFYETTYLKEASDIDKIYDLCDALLGFEIYTQDEASAFVEALLRKESANAINARLDNAVSGFTRLEQEQKEDFYQKARNFVKKYAFLSFILPYEDENLWANAEWLRHLIKKLPEFKDEALPREFLKSIDLQSYKLVKQDSGKIALQSDGELLPSTADGSKKPQDEQQWLDEIVREFNQRYGDIEWGDEDKLKSDIRAIKDDILGNDEFRLSVKNTDEQTTKNRINKALEDRIVQIYDINEKICEKLTQDEEFKTRFVERVFEEWLRVKNAS